jgi:hypothetical protein
VSKVAMLAHSSRMALDRRAEASTTLRKAVCVNGIISLRQKTATKRDGYGRRDSTARVDRRWHTPIDGGDGRPPPATQSQLRVATAGTPAAAPAPVEVAAAAPAPSETAAAAPAGKAAAVAPAPVEACTRRVGCARRGGGSGPGRRGGGRGACARRVHGWRSRRRPARPAPPSPTPTPRRSIYALDRLGEEVPRF